MQPDESPASSGPAAPCRVRAALVDCIASAIPAADGRGRRWPRERCAKALRQAGTSAAVAAACADAAVAVACTIADSANAAQAALQASAGGGW